ncbi:MAG: leucine-rich repeat domain-containing protein, partial [Bacteroidales bacterium]|nr:leucine-rich repeat domain-containing protein [Bacteroidales bacterium]
SMEVIPTSTFENCWRLDSIVIPAGVYRIGNHAFAYCRGLVSVQFSTPSTLDSLGFGAFENCNSLSTMDLSQTKIRVLSRKSFAYCPSLRELKLPSTLKVIADMSLIHEESLQYLVVPESVERISYNSTWEGGFDELYQDSLRTQVNYILQSPTPPNLYMNKFNDYRFGTDSTFLHVYNKDTFYVPCGYEQVYRQATDRNWIVVANVREASYTGEIFLDSVCGPEVQQRYGFYPDHSGDYCERFNPGGYACDSIAVFHVTLATRPTMDDSSVQIEPNKQDTSVLWTWEGTGYAYNVYRNGDYITTVEQPSYLDSNIEMDVQYCYNFAPVNEKYCEGKWSTTNCYTMLSDTTGVAEHDAAHSLVIYPNPAKNVLFISANESSSVNGSINGTVYEITDITGRMVLQGNYNATEGIRVSGLAKGIYLLRLEGKVGKFGKN